MHTGIGFKWHGGGVHGADRQNFRRGQKRHVGDRLRCLKVPKKITCMRRHQIDGFKGVGCFIHRQFQHLPGCVYRQDDFKAIKRCAVAKTDADTGNPRFQSRVVALALQ